MGILVTWQLRTDVPPVATNFVSDEYEAKEELLKSFLDEQAYLQNRIVALRQEIDERNIEIESETEESKVALLDQLKKDVGLTKITGEGVEILLSDSPAAAREGADVTNKQLVQAADLRDLINLLFASNADAIAINQQRVIATTPITSVGTSLLINSSHITPPLTIRAIGDTDLMVQRLVNADENLSFYGRILAGDLVFEVAIREDLVLPIYNGDLRTEYTKLVE